MSRKEVVAVVAALLLVVVVDSQQQLANCQQRCGQFYLEFQQVSAQYDACIHGCDFYNRLDERTGDQPINTLQNCNDSCDERYEQENSVPACQAGCGFSFDAASTGLNPPPPTRPPPPPPHQQQQQPLHMVQRTRPSVISINLPSLLGQINRMMPQIGHMMQMRQQQQQQVGGNPLAAVMMMDRQPAMLDDMVEEEEEASFLRSNSAGPDSNEEDFREESREDSNEEEEEFPLMMSSVMTAPEQQQRPRGFASFFGRKDDEEDLVDPFFGGLFANINQQMNRLMQTVPRVDSWPSWRDPLSSFRPQISSSGGKMMVLRAGPGYHEQKEYDIGPDGQITEVTTPPTAEAASVVIMDHDGLSHENPMESHVVGDNDVEIFDSSKLLATGNSIEELQKDKDMDIVAAEKKKEEGEEKEAISGKQDQLPFLSVLRSSVEENQRFGQQLINRYNSQFRDGDFIEEDICHNQNVNWSDWVACVHARLGVPRWLTAATISLGIIFSVWLCLVIPSSAPKQRLRALIIRGKPSQLFSCQAKKAATAAEIAAAAKEAEANGQQQPTVAYIKVDLPPSYLDVTPGSPAPSYKSDMMMGAAAAACPDSPTPSYKSVDGKEQAKGDKNLEPVHVKKESEA